VQIGRRVGEQLVPADVIEVQVGVDDPRDVLGLVAGLLELRRDGLLVRLLGQLEGQHGLDVLEVIAGVEQEEPVVVLDQHAVDGEPNRVAGPDVPRDVRLVDDERAVVQQ
jgi:hypothetical protein